MDIFESVSFVTFNSAVSPSAKLEVVLVVVLDIVSVNVALDTVAVEVVAVDVVAVLVKVDLV